MKTKLILLFSHKLTPKQEEDARKTFKTDMFIYLPELLQDIWSNIPADLTELSEVLNPIKQWLNEIANNGDYILIQGDFGATCYFVQWAIKNNLNPVYSTTKRIHIERMLPNGKIEINKAFEHTIFRKYPVCKP